MVNDWVNVYPTLKPEAQDPKIEFLSVWIKNIQKIVFYKEKGSEIHVVVALCDNKEQIEEKFDTFKEALPAWRNLQSCLGIKTNRRRGPKKRFFEDFKNMDE